MISDEGLRGFVVINKSAGIQWGKDNNARVDSGYNLDRFVREVSQRGWGDLTFAAGIPGSLGGAIVGGAGAFGRLVVDYLLDADILRRDGSICVMDAKDLGIQYRDSEARRRGDILLAVTMGTFSSQSTEALLSEIQRVQEERKQKHPGADLPSAGSFFKNLPPPEPGAHRIPAGKLLDEAGAKELRVGGARVFPKHANIIVNTGAATAADIIELANQMAALVKEKFGVELEREAQYLC